MQIKHLPAASHKPLQCVVPWATLATQPASHQLLTLCMQATQPAAAACKTSGEALDFSTTEDSKADSAADLTDDGITKAVSSSSTCSDTIVSMVAKGEAALEVVVDGGAATVAKAAAGGCAMAPGAMPGEKVSCCLCNSSCQE